MADYRTFNIESRVYEINDETNSLLESYSIVKTVYLMSSDEINRLDSCNLHRAIDYFPASGNPPWHDKIDTIIRYQYIREELDFINGATKHMTSPDHRLRIVISCTGDNEVYAKSFHSYELSRIDHLGNSYFSTEVAVDDASLYLMDYMGYNNG